MKFFAECRCYRCGESERVEGLPSEADAKDWVEGFKREHRDKCGDGASFYSHTASHPVPA